MGGVSPYFSKVSGSGVDLTLLNNEGEIPKKDRTEIPRKDRTDFSLTSCLEPPDLAADFATGFLGDGKST